MIIGFIDRIGLQTGRAQYTTDTSSTVLKTGHSGGDLLRACLNVSGQYELEGNATCGSIQTNGDDNNRGPGDGGTPELFGEYYYQETAGTGGHNQRLWEL